MNVLNLGDPSNVSLSLQSFDPMVVTYFKCALLACIIGFA